MWKKMLKGLKNVCDEVMESKIGDQLRQAGEEIKAQFLPETEAEAAPSEPVKAESVAVGAEPKQTKEEGTVCEPADAEVALSVPAEDGEREEFEILSEQSYSFLVPPEDCFTNQWDYHAAEIYQGYAYERESESESVSDMYFSIAAEFNCEIKESYAKAAYTRYEGAPIRSKLMTVEHSVFTHVYLFESAKTYRLTYLKKIDETELLGCELVLKKSVATPEEKERILREFKRFAGSCREV
ncbi:MAG: hypothetical protein IJW37_07715 [Lachnospiraceae bacterium]|nr:hypothetical protein [Lachnospiraceae bacterium]